MEKRYIMILILIINLSCILLGLYNKDIDNIDNKQDFVLNKLNPILMNNQNINIYSRVILSKFPLFFLFMFDFIIIFYLIHPIRRLMNAKHIENNNLSEKQKTILEDMKILNMKQLSKKYSNDYEEIVNLKNKHDSNINPLKNRFVNYIGLIIKQNIIKNFIICSILFLLSLLVDFKTDEFNKNYQIFFLYSDYILNNYYQMNCFLTVLNLKEIKSFRKLFICIILIGKIFSKLYDSYLTTTYIKNIQKIFISILVNICIIIFVENLVKKSKYINTISEYLFKSFIKSK